MSDKHPKPHKDSPKSKNKSTENNITPDAPPVAPPPAAAAEEAPPVIMTRAFRPQTGV